MDAAFWNSRCAVANCVYGESANAFVAATASQIPAGQVLCLAEGKGRNAVHLAALRHRVTAVDPSDVGMAKAAGLPRCEASSLKPWPPISHTTV